VPTAITRPPAGARGVDRRPLAASIRPFGVHLMISGIVGLTGNERARADMERSVT